MEAKLMIRWQQQITTKALYSVCKKAKKKKVYKMNIATKHQHVTRPPLLPCTLLPYCCIQMSERQSLLSTQLIKTKYLPNSE